MEKYLIICCFAVAANFCFAQDIDTELLKDWQLKGYAESAERYNDAITAVKYYSEYYNRNTDDYKIALKLANIYFEMNDFEKAKKVYLNLLKNKRNKYPEALLNYGKILKYEGRTDSALSCFLIYRDELIYKMKKNTRNKALYMIENEIKACEEMLEDENKKNENVRIIKLDKNVNTFYKESSPIIWNDTLLIYTSYMADSIPSIKINGETNLPMERYYAVNITNNEKTKKTKVPEPFINIENKSVSGGVLSDDGKRFYFAAGYKDIYGNFRSSIYVRNLENGKWSDPELLDNDINLKKYISTQPCIGKCYNPDFDIIYFVSDRPGGYGGTDIWYTVYDKTTKEYRKPVNAGGYINTPGNEITPYVNNETKAFYFSSDGYSGYGGYDVYKTYGELVNWIPPENIGRPFNSSFNDFWFVKSENDTSGFFVSNRKEYAENRDEGCCYDIFEYIKINKETIVITDTIYETGEEVYGELTDNKKMSDNKKVSKKTIVKLHVKNKDNGEYVFLKADTTDNSGKFKFEIEKNRDYKITIEKDNFVPASLMLNRNKLYKENSNSSDLTIIPVRDKPVTLNNIYFEFDKWTLTEESKQYLDTFLYQILKKNKNLVIEISAHTDGLGDENYNLELSAKRAESVADYLIQKGINPDRLITKGYGESRPIADEKTENGEDNPEARAKNRRIEFKVVGVMVKNY